MNKIDLKLIIWGIISALAVFAAFVSESVLIFVLSLILALFSMFIICLAAHPGIRIFAGVLILVGANFASGFDSLVAAVLFVILPALVMSYVIRVSKDFSVTLIAGAVIICAGVMVYDSFVLTSAVGGLRVLFTSAIDSMAESWLVAFRQLSEQGGMDLSATIGYLDSYFYGLKLMLPAVIIIISLFASCVVLLFSRRFILNIPVPPFFLMRAPKGVAYAYCFGYIFSAFASGGFGIVINNAVVVLTSVMMVSGLSLLRFVTKRIRSKALSVVAFIVAVSLVMNIPYILVTAGTVDAIIDFRRRRR